MGSQESANKQIKFIEKTAKDLKKGDILVLSDEISQEFLDEEGVGRARKNITEFIMSKTSGVLLAEIVYVEHGKSATRGPGIALDAKIQDKAFEFKEFMNFLSENDPEYYERNTTTPNIEKELEDLIEKNHNPKRGWSFKICAYEIEVDETVQVVR